MQTTKGSMVRRGPVLSASQLDFSGMPILDGGRFGTRGGAHAVAEVADH
jgi:hypothetical protein